MWLSRDISLFVVISIASALAHLQADLGENQIPRQTVPGELCARRRLEFAFLAQSSGLLKTESLPTNNCRAVARSWLPSAQIFQVTGVQHTDVIVSITFVRAAEKSPIRTVTALGRLVVNKSHENDEANEAVSNELMRISGYKPNYAR
jgi:hypothetical protein